MLYLMLTAQSIAGKSATIVSYVLSCSAPAASFGSKTV